jgi:hypothetical protein
LSVFKVKQLYIASLVSPEPLFILMGIFSNHRQSFMTTDPLKSRQTFASLDKLSDGHGTASNPASFPASLKGFIL